MQQALEKLQISLCSIRGVSLVTQRQNQPVTPPVSSQQAQLSALGFRTGQGGEGEQSRVGRTGPRLQHQATASPCHPPTPPRASPKSSSASIAVKGCGTGRNGAESNHPSSRPRPKATRRSATLPRYPLRACATSPSNHFSLPRLRGVS